MTVVLSCTQQHSTFKTVTSIYVVETQQWPGRPVCGRRGSQRELEITHSHRIAEWALGRHIQNSFEQGLGLPFYVLTLNVTIHV